MRLLVFLMPVFAFSGLVHAEGPFNFNTTPGKLPKTVLPKEYAVRIVPDLRSLTFTGSETVQLEVREPVRELVLNALEMKITEASLDGRPLRKSTLHLDADEETLTIDLPNELATGEHQLGLHFNGKINQQGQGLFYARNEEKETKAKKIMLGTQFEPTDARRMFPCWDEPSFRARFQLTAVVPNEFMAISNMPVESEKKVAKGKEVRFAQTPPMSSYLVVLCAGELEAVEGEQDGVKLRVITTKGKGASGRYALESEAKILHYYNDYFGTPYPLPKLDLIAIPGGFGGAMENWGGITFYESALLFDPQTSSLDTKQSVFSVIAHEMAHQWFGDLVTTAWWDNLWLNEGFASWMAAKCTDHFYPQWNEWLRHSVSRDPSQAAGDAKNIAMEADARSTTHPVQQPVKSEAEANDAFDSITYRKGQSILRMFENFLGPDVFRDGIRKYIATHKYSNTTTADLWAALTDVSGKPMNELAPDWTQQPGFPVIKVARAEGTVQLSQKRFTVHFPHPPPLTWQVPLTYETQGQNGSSSFLLREKAAALPNELADDLAIKLNVNNGGFYRVQYDDASWKLLSAQIPQLSEADRLNLLNDAWAMVEADRRPLAHYLEILPAVLPNDQLAVYQQIIDTFVFIDRLLAGDAERAAFEKFACAQLRPAFARIGWEIRPNESLATSRLRGPLIRGLGLLGDKEVIAGCRERFARFLKNPQAILPDLRPAILGTVGRYADARTWEQLHQLGLATTSTEEKQTDYDALAGVLDPQLIPRVLEISLTNELPVSRATTLLSYSARYGEHPEMVWNFAQKHMKTLLAKQDALGTNNFVANLFNFTSQANDAATLEAYTRAHLPKGAAKSVAKTVDEIGFRAEFQKRLEPQLKAWLAKANS